MLLYIRLCLKRLPVDLLPDSLSSHVVEIEATGPGPHGSEFAVHIVRNNPAPSGGVTGKETYGSFLSSLMGMLSILSL